MTSTTSEIVVRVSSLKESRSAPWSRTDIKNSSQYSMPYIAENCSVVAALAYLNTSHPQEMSELNFEAVLTFQLALLVRHRKELCRAEDRPFLLRNEFPSTME